MHTSKRKISELFGDFFSIIKAIFYALIWKNQTQGTAFIIGRFSPPHKGHINVILWLLTRFDKVVIGIGSCYEVGRSRHPLLAIFREKMILASLTHVGVDLSRITIVHIPDYPSATGWSNEWWRDISAIIAKYSITHFVTGNEEQIRGPLRELNIPLTFELINPETEMPAKYAFPFHASDLRKAIADGDYEKFLLIAATGTISIMGSIGGFTAIRIAMDNRGVQFVPGRQAVDLIVTCKDENILYLLCGRRSMHKENFPGYLGLTGGGIDPFESPLDAASRECQEESLLKVEIVNRSVEPTHVVVAERFISEMWFVGLYGTTKIEWAGTQGGSSQVFHIHLDATPSQLNDLLGSPTDLDDVMFRPVEEVLREGLSYQQNAMVEKAIGMMM